MLSPTGVGPLSATWIFLLSSILLVTQAKTDLCGGIIKDESLCPGIHSFQTEALCLRRQNKLVDLMSCVAPVRKGQSEDEYCDLIFDDPSGYDKYGRAEDPKYVNCVTPRAVILSGSNMPDCLKCWTGGAIRSCPKREPIFSECLCDQNVDDAKLLCLSSCFLFPKGYRFPKFCGTGHSKRALVGPGAGLDARAQSDRLSPNLQDVGGTFYIDRGGRPIFLDKNGDPIFTGPNELYSLPYFDERFGDGSNGEPVLIKRCFVYPYSPRLWCYQWYIRAQQAGDYDYAKGAPPRVTYTSTINHMESVATTQTLAPTSVADPTVTPTAAVSPITKSGTTDGGKGSQESSGAASTTASGKGSSMAAGNSVPLLVVLGLQVLFVMRERVL
ncbi:hypothetical protein IF1G_01179 [Cordyceps javanica]|uniref:Uncharacterized protein n=1 Tax=Cordyceps javanica TaxID=43265 RepID=A0A545VHN4_9HYPO|nr:hypothetical protein IF1G_01179 [Cordyceps javanica]TQW12398.1 hypothetical protein IF2G_01129 [Cordyceps javanica]